MSIFRKKIPCLRNFHSVIRNTLSNPRKNGLPPEVDGEVLQKICRNHFDSPIVKTTYVHLSMWKKQGAYKIVVNMKNGKNFSLFYKFDNFSLENMPALKSFPVPFGNVEHSLYSFPFPPMNVYLPKVYYVRKRDGSLIHQYYLEDLSRDYENIAFGDKNSILFAAKKIKEITCFLTKWKESFKIDDFTIFDGTIKKEISKNALRNFKSLQKKRPNKMLETLIKQWDNISDLYTNYDPVDKKDLIPIHGDFNRGNLWINKKNRNIIKLTDWDSSRMGLPHSDLASLLARQPHNFENEILLEFSKCFDEYTIKENREYYWYCKMDKAILGLSYLIASILSINKKINSNVKKLLDNEISIILSAYREKQ